MVHGAETGGGPCGGPPQRRRLELAYPPVTVSHERPPEKLAREAADAFRTDGRLARVRPLTIGHIHDTYLVTREAGVATHRYLLQRINSHVLTAPARVMVNIMRVTEHLRGCLQREGREVEADRLISVVPARNGEPWWRDRSGDWWRTYTYVENSRSYDSVEAPELAYRGARAFGDFARLLASLPGPRLEETIPQFHDTPARFAALQGAVSADPLNRAAQAAEAIAFAEVREPLARVLTEPQGEGKLPERVVHNDTKFNNVLFDRDSGQALCVVDLDTVMPGLLLHDFGDLVRSTLGTVGEAAREPAALDLRPPIFEAVARGYMAGAGAILKNEEAELMYEAAQMITLELGMRFLADHLQGDRYFGAMYPGQNLERACSQFRLLARMEERRGEMERILEKVFRER
jgi:aminoglycoside phosphotransferase (APT) family kinase protein